MALGAGQFQGFRAKVEIKDFPCPCCAGCICAHSGDLACDGRRRTLHDDLRAIGNRRLHAIGSAHRATLIVIFENLDFLAVETAGFIDLAKLVKHRRTIEKAGRGLRA